MSLFIVILSGFFHALWNVIAKKSRNKIGFLLGVQLLSLIFFFPYVVMHFGQIVWSWKSVAALAATMIFHGIYCILLARAYTVADVSKIYPIARGTSSLLIPLLAVLALGERLSVMGWCGVLAVVFGILLLNETVWSVKGLKKLIHPHTVLALMVGVCVAAYILMDKANLRYFPLIVLNWAGTVGNIVFLLFAVRSKKRLFREWKVNFRWIALGAILAPGSYMMFLWAIQHDQVAQLAPIREIGTVFGVALGVLVLKEARGVHRLVASSIITAGILLLGFNI